MLGPVNPDHSRIDLGDGMYEHTLTVTGMPNHDLVVLGTDIGNERARKATDETGFSQIVLRTDTRDLSAKVMPNR